MAQMTHCSGCQKHYFRHEAACPHCGAAGRSGPVRAFVRQAKMGGLMLFTALTTTACYGTPAMIEGPGGVMPPGYEQPEPKVPATPGVAYAFLQPKEGETAQRTLKLKDAELTGAMLTIGSADGRLKVTIEVIDAAALRPADGVQESIPLSAMKALTVEATVDGERLAIQAPGEVSAGYLQIARLDDETIGGTLRLEKDGQVFDLYFLAGR